MTGQHFAIFDTAIGRCGIVWGERGINGVQCRWDEDKTRKRIASAMATFRSEPPAAVQARDRWHRRAARGQAE
jgi:methylated-DNA-[protein]-cysteine S-methyltransferase